MKNKPGSVVWILVGVFLLVMGLYFLINPKATLTSIAWLFGLTMLVSGIADLVLYAARQWAYGASVWFYADGIIDVLIGIAFLCNDWLAAELLPYILAVWAVMGAVLYRRQGMPFWGAQAVAGAAVLIFGVATLFRPMIAVVAVSFVVAVVLIIQGLMALMRGLFVSAPRR